MGRFFEVRHKGKIWRDLFPLFGHATSYLTRMAREGCPPEQAYDASSFVAPLRGFLLKDYMPEREALYWESGEASVALLMGSYASAAGASEEAARWMKLAIDESRRVGALFIQVASGTDAVAALLAGGRFVDAVEAGGFVGRGMVVDCAVAARDRGNFEGVGIDLTAEFRKLPEGQRRLGDQFALISGVLPVAIALVRLPLADPSGAVDAGQRVAALCRELAEDESGDRELWQTAAELFESASVASTSARLIVALLRTIGGEGERATALRVLLPGVWRVTEGPGRG